MTYQPTLTAALKQCVTGWLLWSDECISLAATSFVTTVLTPVITPSPIFMTGHSFATLPIHTSIQYAPLWQNTCLVILLYDLFADQMYRYARRTQAAHDHR